MMHLVFLVSHRPFSIWYFTLRWWAHSCTTSLPFKAPPFGSNFPLSSPRLSSLTYSLLPFNISPAWSEASSFFLSVSYQRHNLAEAALFFWIGNDISFFRAIISLTVWIYTYFPFSLHGSLLFFGVFFASPFYFCCFFLRLDVCLSISMRHFYIVSFLCSLFDSWGDKR